MLAKQIKNVTFVDWSKFNYRTASNIDTDQYKLFNYFFFEPFSLTDFEPYERISKYLKIG